MFEVVGLQGSRNDKILFSKITFKLNSGEWLWVRGKNGQGKSTLLKMLAGLLIQDSGCIYWEGQKLQRFDPSFLQNMIYLGHVPALNPLLSFMENLRWAQKLREDKVITSKNNFSQKPDVHNVQNPDVQNLQNPDVQNVQNKVPHPDVQNVQNTVPQNTQNRVSQNNFHQELSTLSLIELQDTPCEQLSFGQKQRAALLMLKLFEQTPLWILDEPATGLDISAKNWLKDKLQQHLTRGGIAVIASHEDLDLTQPPFILDLGKESRESLKKSLKIYQETKKIYEEA